MRFLNYLNDSTVSGADVAVKFSVPMKNKEKFKKLNPKTNRMKTSRKTIYLETNIRPEDREYENIPKYADGNHKVRFQDWLELKKEDNGCYGKSCNGKWFGWSHRAIASFKPGHEVKSADNMSHDPKRKMPYKIKDDEDARLHAIRFAKSVS